MTMRIWLAANTLYYPTGGGHQWVFLNWALGLRALGCSVIWLERVVPTTPPREVQALLATLRARLAHYGLVDGVAVTSWSGGPLSAEATAGAVDLEQAAEADLLLNTQYELSADVVRRFRRSALLDIDPGLLQEWVGQGHVRLAPHDVYFTIGETVGQPGARVPDLGVRWHYTPPCVALDWWPPCAAPAEAPFTTVAHWYASTELRPNEPPDDKRTGFQPYLTLPRRVAVPLELAVDFGPDDDPAAAAERAALRAEGWHLCHPRAVAATPAAYQQYIQRSRGEFSCVKPACIRLQNAWVSDRTICYLASGKPCVVQHTGPSRFLPDRGGLFRFRDLSEAIAGLETASADYAHHSGLARALAEEYFDAQRLARGLLERALA